MFILGGVSRLLLVATIIPSLVPRAFDDAATKLPLALTHQGERASPFRRRRSPRVGQGKRATAAPGGTEGEIRSEG